VPYVSEAQRRFFHTDTARKAGITPSDVKHWDEAYKGKKLPEHHSEKTSFMALFDAAQKYAGIQAPAILEHFVMKMAFAMASSNALQGMTTAQKPLTTGVGANRGLANPMGLGHALNPTKGMAGTGLGPRANPLAEPAASRAGAFDSLLQNSMQNPGDKMKDGATLPARV
jgi:hypothetical protein